MSAKFKAIGANVHMIKNAAMVSVYRGESTLRVVFSNNQLMLEDVLSDIRATNISREDFLHELTIAQCQIAEFSIKP